MNTKRVKERKSNSMWIAVIYGVVISIGISILGCVIGAIFVDKEIIGSFTTIMAMVVWIVSSFLGTMIATRLVNGNKLIILGITAVVYLFILVCASILFIDGSFMTLWQGSVSVLIGTGLTMVICSNRKADKRHKVKYRK